MARGGKKGENVTADPEGEERAKLKKLAFCRNILSRSPAKVGRHAAVALAPSKTVVKHHGRDILRKSQRKNKYLFSFPGLLGPISGGKIGELKDLGTKNPVLYLDFPQGQMKLFGTIVYPKNRYLTLQFSRGGKNVTCDDYLDNMIVFSDVWWIGTKEENPEELQLKFPKDLNVEKIGEYDFKAGAGASCDSKQGSGKSAMKCLGQDSPKVNREDNLTESPSDFEELTLVTPARQSARTAGKTFNFAEASSGEDLIGNGDKAPEEEDEKDDPVSRKEFTPIETESSSPVVFEIDNGDSAREDEASEQDKQSGKAKVLPGDDQKSLIQTTLYSLFKRADDKASKITKGIKIVEERETGTVTKEQKRQHKKIVLGNTDTIYKRTSKSKTSDAFPSNRRKANVVSASQSSDSPHFSDEDREDFSSTSKDMGESDEDWTA